MYWFTTGVVPYGVHFWLQICWNFSNLVCAGRFVFWNYFLHSVWSKIISNLTIGNFLFWKNLVHSWLNCNPKVKWFKNCCIFQKSWTILEIMQKQKWNKSDFEVILLCKLIKETFYDKTNVYFLFLEEVGPLKLCINSGFFQFFEDVNCKAFLNKSFKGWTCFLRKSKHICLSVSKIFCSCAKLLLVMLRLRSAENCLLQELQLAAKVHQFFYKTLFWQYEKNFINCIGQKLFADLRENKFYF